MKLPGVLSALLALSLHLVLLSFGALASAEAVVLSEIEIVRTDKETRVYLKADGTIKNYRKVELKKNVKAGRPDRMYLDIRNVRLAGPIPAQEAGTALARVRTAPRGKGFRVVFDSGLEGLFEYTVQEQPEGLLVTILEPAVVNADVEIIPEEQPDPVPETVAAPLVETIYPEPKVAGDLMLLIVTSDSPDYAREWLNAPSDQKKGLKLLKEVKPNQETSTSFLVTGLTPDSDGNFSYVISIVLLDPFGKPMVNQPRYANVAGRAPAQPAFVLTEPELALILDNSDPVGDYKMIGIVQDLISNKVGRSSTKITLAN
ncbi:MAG: AMIN domain-containing protein [Proteobacteria bacterium]|nr:AMIN domain-containing protein [Pseudomonadota bacterium]MBU1739027.1 AMIN domain-containing protein [Pseudomonadota bacterium]